MLSPRSTLFGPASLVSAAGNAAAMGVLMRFIVHGREGSRQSWYCTHVALLQWFQSFLSKSYGLSKTY